MNLNESPTIGELAAIFAGADDADGDHVLWVDQTGDVHLSCLNGPDAANLTAATPSVLLRYETFRPGENYVGLSAAEDRRFMAKIFGSLWLEWSRAIKRDEVTWIDRGRAQLPHRLTLLNCPSPGKH